VPVPLGLAPPPRALPAAVGAPADRSLAEPRRQGGDLGWALACAGLLAAAALLGRPRRSPPVGVRPVGRMLPLLGRR
jgi:hypothetical protein